MELYKKHRPTRLSELVGQEAPVRMLAEYGKAGRMPHCMLFHGPHGCGKTTAARIVRVKLGCSDMDYKESNSAEDRGIDAVRSIMERMMSAPMGGRCRMWVIDEAHALTKAAQEAFLKPLEDTPPHVYFVLATTDPSKLLPTVRSRATEFKFAAVKAEAMAGLLCRVAGAEGFALDEDVRDRIVEVADGSPRKALVLLDQVVGIADKAGQLAAVVDNEASRETVDLCRALLAGERWPKLKELVKAIDEEPETIRRSVLGYMTSVLLGGGGKAGRAYDVIAIFEKSWYDGGKASLAASCWEAAGGGK